MRGPAFTVPSTDDVSGSLGRHAQPRTRAWGHRPNPFLDQRPARLDRVEVGRVRGQEAHGRPGLFNQGPDSGGLMRRQVIEDHDVVGPQDGDQPVFDPGAEARGVDGASGGPEGQPPIDADHPDHRQVVAPIHRRGSTSSVPRSSQAWDRPIARFPPDSSRNTSRRASIPAAYSRKRSRSACTRARSCSAGRRLSS